MVHASRQHVLLKMRRKCQLLSARFWRLFPPPPALSRSGPCLLNVTSRSLNTTFKRPSIQNLGLTPASLRDGDATDFWLRTRDVPALRRRGWVVQREDARTLLTRRSVLFVHRLRVSRHRRTTGQPYISRRPSSWPVRRSRHPPQHLLYSCGGEVVLTGRSLSGQASCSVPGSQQSRHGDTHSLRWAEQKKSDSVIQTRRDTDYSC